MQRVVLDDGATIAYHDEGAGPPILLMHGYTGTAAGDMGLLIEELRADHRVIAPDLRGYGASRPPARDFPVDFYQRDADDMAALLDRIAPGPLVAIGFSDGGESALLLAAARPDLVRGVIAIGVCGIISQPMLRSVQGWLPVERWEREHPGWRQDIVESHGADQVAPMIEGWMAATTAIGAAGGDVALEAADKIACPTLVINGDGETGNPPADARRLVERIPAGRIAFVAGSGHSVQRDQPARLIELVRGFLAEIAG
jgi:valacyclovir hydrolase